MIRSLVFCQIAVLSKRQNSITSRKFVSFTFFDGTDTKFLAIGSFFAAKNDATFLSNSSFFDTVFSVFILGLEDWWRIFVESAATGSTFTFKSSSMKIAIFRTNKLKPLKIKCLIIFREKMHLTIGCWGRRLPMIDSVEAKHNGIL